MFGSFSCLIFKEVNIRFPDAPSGCLSGTFERFLPGVQRFRVGTHSQGFRVGAHSVERPRGMEGHGAHGLCVLQLVHFHKLCFGLPRLNKTAEK